uniref:PABS domain-containing protein n=1 Tax=Oryza rufipogon TaxID=4529 RepID=A0A0E0NP32_ORYRU
MATNTMPLTFSPPRLLHRHRRREAKPQRRSATGVSLLPRRGAASAPRRLYCAPSGGGEVSAPPADEQQEQAAKEEKEEYTLLAITGNVHSVLPKTGVWTNSYWDEFVSLPAVVPRGPVALLGLGAGTAAHLMLKFYPWLQLVGWEIDPKIIELSRDYFGLSDLEKATESGGSLSVRIGDALSPSATIEGGFAGIVVDLFADGKIIPQLQEVETWLEIAKKLMPDGRIMVNCGGADAAVSLADDMGLSSWVQNPTIKALCAAFPGQLNWKRLSEKESVNYVALTGPLPDLDEWSTSVPSEMSSKVKQWAYASDATLKCSRNRSARCMDGTSPLMRALKKATMLYCCLCD